MLNGLSQINVELCSDCDKSCPFCGHQDAEVNPNLVRGSISIPLLSKISKQVPAGIVSQFHRDGESLLHPKLGAALEMFSHCIRSIVTNGKKLVAKAEEIIDNCESLTVSAFNADVDGPEQLEVVRKFLELKGDRPPMVNIKIVGFMSPEREQLYAALGVPIIRRLIHVPDGNYRYAKRNPTIPESGICLDFLSHPSIDWRGQVFVCNRLDAQGQGLLGSLHENTLDELWNSPKRREWLAAHMRGRRDQAAPICKTCLYWGIPSEA